MEMKRRFLSAIAILLLVVMAFSAVGCNVQPDGPDGQTTEAGSDTEKVTETPTEAPSDEPDENTTEKTAGEDTTEQGGEQDTEEETDAVVEYTGKYADIIYNANELANTVQEYRSNAKADSYFIENSNMKLEYILKSSEAQQIASLVNSQGKSYIENTFDAFVRLKNGGTYFSSQSPNEIKVNNFRFGYYYDEFRIEGQNFVNGFSIRDEYNIDLSIGAKKNSGKTNLKAKYSKGILTAEIMGSDPYFSFEGINLPADEYKYAQITLKTTDDNSSASIYVAAGEHTDANAEQIVDFEIYPADEQYHTYLVYLGSIKDYNGTLHSVRIDLNGMEEGKMVEISEFKILSADEIGTSSLSTARIFHTYSDKLHHELQVVAHYETHDIEAIGMKTEIAADTVDKLIVKDANGLHETLDGVDWATAEYIGFDIKEAGIFGYILPVHETTGKMTVTLEDGKYVIIQERAPEGNTLIPGEGKSYSNNNPTGNTGDFYMAQRLYTDENHTFDAFLKEAEIERHPLTAKNIKVSTGYSTGGKFLGYDAIRGVYEFYIGFDEMNHIYFKAPNKHYELNFTVKSDDYDRNLYIMAANEGGHLECAAILDENLMMLPIPIEVAKNFTNDGDDDIYDLLDEKYSEAILPICLSANEAIELNLLHLYHNWGNFPLKEVSSIEFYSPYYHLTTGAIETNCINFERPVSMLPDHRAMSAPFWSNSPQHTSGGAHSFLNYIDENGGSQSSYNVYKIIDSYGPIYGNTVTKYYSTDNKILATYEHLEMPQTDENRGYYTMTFEFLEDMSFSNFKKQFAFYTLSDNDPAGEYQLFGYLDENNQPQVTGAKTSGPETTYVLGTEAPYFDYCNMTGAKGAGGPAGWYVNVSFIICDSEIIIGGEEVTPNFIVREGNLNAALSLDLGAVNFKAGDKITINAIITPWGSQDSDYSGAEFAPDQNVRNVREDSALDPFKITAGENAKVVKSAFLPSVKTTNGKSAEFTISGGENNAAIRVYGFTELSAPKVYEKINGEWVPYELSSANNPDPLGYKYNYDGYGVYFDKTGTFSYAFIVTMTDGAPRTFKVETDSEFEQFARIPITENRLSPYNVYIDSVDFAKAAGTWPMFTNILSGSEGTMNYTTLVHSAQGGAECFMPLYQNTTNSETGEVETVTGQYLVLKYRVPESNPDELQLIQFFANSESADINAGAYVTINAENGFISDGQWHVIVIDCTAVGSLPKAVSPDANGDYKIQYVRFDPFNQKAGARIGLDVAFFAIHGDLGEICEANTDVSEILLVGEYGYTRISTATGEPIQ